jgi:hypothetical protein
MVVSERDWKRDPSWCSIDRLDDGLDDFAADFGGRGIGVFGHGGIVG